MVIGTKENLKIILLMGMENIIQNKVIVIIKVHIWMVRDMGVVRS
jgi:hypothetical protein